MPTIFNHLNPPILDDQQYFFLIIVYVIMTSGLLLNFFFLVILLINWKQVFKSSNLLLCLNLSTADTFFYVQGIIERFPLLTKRSFPTSTDPTVGGLITYSFGCYALFSLCLMAFDRYTIIVHGVQTSIRRLVLGIVVCIVLALFSASFAVFLMDTPFLHSDSGLYFSVHLGSQTPGGFAITVFVLAVQLIALNFILMSYFKIVRAVRNTLFKPLQFSYSVSLPRPPGMLKTTKSADFKETSPTTLVESNNNNNNNNSSSSGGGGGGGGGGGHTNSFATSSATSNTPSRCTRKARDLEIVIVRKAIAIASIHLLLWLPYVSYCLLLLVGVNNLRFLDFFVVMGIESSSCVNSVFSLLMDPKVKRFAANFFAFFKPKIDTQRRPSYISET